MHDKKYSFCIDGQCRPMFYATYAWSCYHFLIGLSQNITIVCQFSRNDNQPFFFFQLIHTLLQFLVKIITIMKEEEGEGGIATFDER